MISKIRYYGLCKEEYLSCLDEISKDNSKYLNVNFIFSGGLTSILFIISFFVDAVSSYRKFYMVFMCLSIVGLLFGKIIDKSKQYINITLYMVIIFQYSIAILMGITDGEKLITNSNAGILSVLLACIPVLFIANVYKIACINILAAIIISFLSINIKIPEVALVDVLNNCGVAILGICVHYEGSKIKLNSILNLKNKEKILKELYKTKQELKIKAEKDQLTGLYNRDKFIGIIDSLRTQYENKEDTIILGILDIDNFKSVNDNYGHIAGDEIIKKVAKVLKRNLGDYGEAARLGGDEFIFVLNTENNIQIVNSIIEDIHNSLNINEKYKNISASIGVVECRKSAIDFNRLYKCADIALYTAKNSGKNKFNIYNQENLEKGLKLH